MQNPTSSKTKETGRGAALEVNHGIAATWGAQSSYLSTWPCSGTRLLRTAICLEMESNEAALGRYKACQKVKGSLKYQKRIGAVEKNPLISTPLHLLGFTCSHSIHANIKGRHCGTDLGGGNVQEMEQAQHGKNWWK